ncbi:MAG: ribonuclease D [Acidobacteriota bacterium]
MTESKSRSRSTGGPPGGPPPGAKPVPDAIPHRYLESAEDLARAVERWRSHDAVALDTEFVRERTFYPALGLVQVAVDGEDGEPEITLVDPVAIDDLSPLAALLDDLSVTKVLHSASEDVEVFQHHLGTVPRPLFDTQIAAGFGGLRASMGLARLVDAILDLHLPKGETRSNWLRRPLRPAQRHYAALDVAYLLDIHRRLRARLDDFGRAAWVAEDTAAMVAPERFATAADGSLHPALWHKLGRGARPPLDPRRLAALRELVEWRERRARDRDLPRGFVLADGDLTPLARVLPTSRSALQKVRGIDHRKVLRHGDGVLAAIERAMALPTAALPEPMRPGIDLSGHKKLVERLRRRVRRIATDLGLEPELLATRRTVERLTRRHIEAETPVLPRELRGWRAAVVGEPLIEELSRSASI